MSDGQILAPNFQRRLPYRLYDSGKYPGLYFDPNPAKKSKRKVTKKIFFERPYVHGRQTFRSLKSITPRKAHRELTTNRQKQDQAKIGTAIDPYTKPRAPLLTVTGLLDRFARAGFPKRKMVSSKRSSREIRELQTHITTLKVFFRDKDPAQLTQEDLGSYHAWRIGQIAARHSVRQKGASEKVANARPGHRAVDKERVTLSLAYEFAVKHSRETGIKTNPFARVQSFADPAEVKHCRDFQPENGDELHRLCAYFIQAGWRSEVLAWQAWFESMIGSRSHEVVRLRLDGKSRKDAGFVEKNSLYLWRSKSTKGTFLYAEIHPALRQCLQAHKAWHDENWPTSPWYFPSPADPALPIGSTALTHGLRRATVELGLPHRTSHGLRSFYVNVLRSGGDRGRKYTDEDIALRIGQRTQGELIVHVYGEVLPCPITWIPENGVPAWSRWLPDPSIPAEQLQLGI